MVKITRKVYMTLATAAENLSACRKTLQAAEVWRTVLPVPPLEPSFKESQVVSPGWLNLGQVVKSDYPAAEEVVVVILSAGGFLVRLVAHC